MSLHKTTGKFHVPNEMYAMQMTVRPNVMQKRLRLAQRLADANGGKLPNPWKMIQQGHGGLYRYIQRHPDEFSHLGVEEAVEKEEKNGKNNFNVAIREEHLENAQQLAQKNGGVLQDTSWLTQHGHTRLASYVKTYPYVFVNLRTPKAEKKRQTHKKKPRKY